MNLIDILALVAVGWGLFKGFQNGVIREVAGLLGLIVGIWAGMRLAFIFANWYQANTQIPENYIPLLAFLTAFLVGLGGIYLAGMLVTRMLQAAMLSLPNRLAGAVFGGLKWAFLLGTLLSMIGDSQVITQDTKDGSATYQPLTVYCQTVQGYTIGLLPAANNVFKDMEEYFVELDSTRQMRRAPQDAAAPEGERNAPDSTGTPATPVE